MTMVVHVNRLGHCNQPQHDSALVTKANTFSNDWFTTQVDHYIISEPPSQHHYPQHDRRPPD